MKKKYKDLIARINSCDLSSSDKKLLVDMLSSNEVDHVKFVTTLLTILRTATSISKFFDIDD